MSRTQADLTFFDIRDVIGTWQLSGTVTMDCLIGRREVCYVVVADIGIHTEEEAQSLHSLLERRGSQCIASISGKQKLVPLGDLTIQLCSDSQLAFASPSLMLIAEER